MRGTPCALGWGEPALGIDLTLEPRVVGLTGCLRRLARIVNGMHCVRGDLMAK